MARAGVAGSLGAFAALLWIGGGTPTALTETVATTKIKYF